VSAGNPSPKLTVTIAPDLYAQILKAAARRGVSVSAWITAAARLALKVRDGLAAVAEWEAEHGAFTDTELKVARKCLVSPRRHRRAIRLPQASSGGRGEA
jgi:hypothetical protein